MEDINVIVSIPNGLYLYKSILNKLFQYIQIEAIYIEKPIYKTFKIYINMCKVNHRHFEVP